ncbi:BED zinc finger [Dictyocaulus viviparus]|uniref:BED zinc finger n=1 Tax=Dictyocaulus viviparus TaxID=29172 RepID=A0A0D8XQF4_DICVI|nr:BED zinc finger [Dictyocaulus viviparus]
MFYYATTPTSAGPSLISQQDPPQLSVHDTITMDSDDTNILQNDINIPQKIRKRSTKRGRPTKNPVWTFFRRIDDKSVQCNMCDRRTMINCLSEDIRQRCAIEDLIGSTFIVQRELVKSACATNMSKHLERHHQTSAARSIPNPRIDMDYGAQKYDQAMTDEAIRAERVVTSYDHYPVDQTSHHITHNVPWNPDRRGTKRNRRTKHPVWELFRRIADGNAQCILCNVVVRSPCSSNFMGHLNRHHAEHYQNIYHRWLDGRVDMPIQCSFKHIPFLRGLKQNLLIKELSKISIYGNTPKKSRVLLKD